MTKQQQATHFIESFLSQGEKRAEDVLRAAKENGISYGTFHRAKSQMTLKFKVISRKRVYWSLGDTHVLPIGVQ